MHIPLFWRTVCFLTLLYIFINISSIINSSYFQVLKTQYSGAKKLKLLGKEVVLVEKHLSCKCDCKIKEEVVNAVYIFFIFTFMLFKKILYYNF